MLKMILNYFVTLFVIIDPSVSLVILLAVLPQSRDKNMHRIAMKSSLAVMIGSSICILLGALVLQLFGVGISSFKVIGGIILLLLAIQMVQAKISSTRYTEKDSSEPRQKADISIIPLAIPGTLGPGTITTLFIYRSQADFIGIIALFIAVFINCVILYFVISYAKKIENFLGKIVINMFTRFMGLIVGAMGVQLIISGTRELWLK
ncbi:MAG: MarC family protein [Brevinematales bacterium]